MSALRTCLFIFALSPAAAAQGIVYLDADSVPTGSGLDVAPLATDFGTITFNGVVTGTSDPEFAAAGSIGDCFNKLAGGSELAFDFDVTAVNFIYGGNIGEISVEARDASGAVVDSFFQASTGAGEPAGPITLTGAGIRSLWWDDTLGGFGVLDNISLRVTTLYLDADTPATGSNLDIAPLMTGFGSISFDGEIVAFTDPEMAAAGSMGSVFDVVGPGSNCEMRFGFDVSSVTFLYGGNVGSILIEARDSAGVVIDSFFQASTSSGEPAGPITLAGNRIRSLYWEDSGGSFAALDNLEIEVGNVYLDADTLATGSDLDVSPLSTPFGLITFNGEVRPTSDPELAAAGSVGDVFDIVSPGNCELSFGFHVEAISFIYGGNTGSILVEARDATGQVIDSFFQASTNAGEPAGPVTLGGAGIRSLYWEDPGFSFAAIDNISIQVARGQIGTPYCDAVANSTGVPARMRATGTSVAADNNVTLQCLLMPPNSFGYFLTSRFPGFVVNPGGSQGNLCLGSSIGRYVGPGQVQNSGSIRRIMLTLDLTQHPQPTGFVTVVAGETWNFQTWFRDAVGGIPTSNFSEGLRIAFR